MSKMFFSDDGHRSCTSHGNERKKKLLLCKRTSTSKAKSLMDLPVNTLLLDC